MEKAYRQLVRYSPFCKISIFIFPSLFKTLSEKNILSKPTNGITPHVEEKHTSCQLIRNFACSEFKMQTKGGVYYQTD